MKSRITLSTLLMAICLMCCTAKNNEKISITLQDEIKLDFVKIEVGTFTMGAPDGENFKDEMEHQVVLTQDFYLGNTEVTQAQWNAVMGNNPSHFRGDNLPVECVSWKDAIAFCIKLNESGMAPEGMKFTLPTESQWEYAARGGKKSKGYQYSGDNNLDKVAWYYENSGDHHLDEKELLENNSDDNLSMSEDNSVVPERTVDLEKLDKNIKDNNNMSHPVGQKNANELGLYDMSGNVWEWCLDKYERDYADDPEFLIGNNGPRYVFRGGGWRGNSSGCRSANRHGNMPDYNFSDLGFRVALVKNQ